MADLKIFAYHVEEEALNQIFTLVKQPAFADCKIRVMPDVHAGKGCVIGFTADMGDKVIPNIVSVDIGCGVNTVELGKIEIDFQKLDDLIRRRVPSGRNANENIICPFDLTGLKCYHYLKEKDWIQKSLGSLGGGNHFIEIDMDADGGKYLVIHTGSRNLGKQVAEYYQNMAIDLFHGRTAKREETEKLIAEYKSAGRVKEIQAGIAALKKKSTPGSGVPKELCYLTGERREAYLHDMKICQQFAALNRGTIARVILNGMGWKSLNSFETVHNYIDHESNIVRKGAISAKKGERLLIPINMRDGCIIGIGKGNPDWNESAPHGAGRVMSRSEAKERVSLEEYEESMRGVFTTSVNRATIDESPMAYKPMLEIIEKISPTVEIERIIKPIYNFKAGE